MYNFGHCHTYMYQFTNTYVHFVMLIHFVLQCIHVHYYMYVIFMIYMYDDT